MTRQERLARLAGLAVTLLPLAPAPANAHQLATPPNAHQVAIPPDTVTTVFVTETVPGLGGVGGVVADACTSRCRATPGQDVFGPGEGRVVTSGEDDSSGPGWPYDPAIL